MSVFPVLLDASLSYMGAGPAAGSLLLLPTGTGSLLAELAESAAAVTAAPPIVLPAFAADAGYERELRAACPAVDEILSLERFRERVDRFDPSDALLIVAPSRYPGAGLDLRLLAGGQAGDARMARHLLAFETSPLQTKELVQPAADGRVRRIQRYFEPVTWPFPAAVVASLVPVACLMGAPELPVASLAELRRALAVRGTPSHDVPFHGHCFDLADEAGVLAFCEHRVLALSAAAALGPRAEVHATARLLGPVVALEGAVVEEGALVVGPTLIAAGARIGADAVVAQCLVPPGATVPAGTTVRHRVIAPEARAQRRHPAPARPPSDVGAPAELRLDYAALKAVVEPVVALVALVALAPLFAVIALCILLTSGRPIFYGDRREGKGGRPFRCWKFRSMRTNADIMQRKLAAQQQMDGPQFKMDRDPRVTPVGRWLRRLNVDELPQLVNVLRGEMSFVGPRPSPFRENQICVPWRHGRLSVRPGITGLWQVCRHDRANGDFHQWIHYDLRYVRHASFLVDLKILLATVLTAGGRRPVALETILGRGAGDPPAPAGRPGDRPSMPTAA